MSLFQASRPTPSGVAPASSLSLTRRRFLAAGGAGLAALGLAACGSDGAPEPQGSASSGMKVTVLTHDSFALPDELIAQFATETGYELVLVPSGSAGEIVNKMILTKDAPLGDAIFGIDNTLASRALDEGLIDTARTVTLPEPAKAEVVADTPALAPIDFGEVCLNVDLAWFAEHGIAAPVSFEDLLREDLRGQFVGIDPTQSSAGLTFFLATVGHFGTSGFADFWKQLVAHDMRIASGWSEAYYSDFSGAGEGGTYPITVGYSSSPALTLNEDETASTTAAVPATATRQVEYAGVIAGAANPEGGQAFVEWMLSVPVQSAIPDSMYMNPIHPDAELSQAIQRFGMPAADPIRLDPAQIASHRDEWLAQWSEAVGK